MPHCRFHVDIRGVDQVGHRLELNFRHVMFETLALSKGADANCITVRGDDWHGFTNMFRGSAVHHDAGAGFKTMDRHVWGNYKRATSKTRHCSLERRQGAQRRA